MAGTGELQHRPGLAALLARAETNGVNKVLVERADRLARDLMVSEVILGQFRALDVTVLTADGQDLTAGDGDPTRVLVRQVLAAVAQFDKTVTVLGTDPFSPELIADGVCDSPMPRSGR